MAVSGKEAVTQICNRAYDRPPQKSKPVTFAHKFPGQAGDVKTKDHLSVNQLAVQNPVSSNRVDMGKTGCEVRCVYIFKLQFAGSVQFFQVQNFRPTKWAHAIVINCKL